MAGLLHFVRRGWTWAGWGPAKSPSRCTKTPINGQCTSFILSMWHYNRLYKGLTKWDAVAVIVSVQHLLTSFAFVGCRTISAAAAAWRALTCRHTLHTSISTGLLIPARNLKSFINNRQTAALSASLAANSGSTSAQLDVRPTRRSLYKNSASAEVADRTRAV